MDTKRGATISECGKYRYNLWRLWDAERPIMVFVMLNPSTADGEQDDPTIRRCIGFARRDGYGGIVVRNVFAFRATNKQELLKQTDPCGPENDEWLLSARNVSLLTRLVVAWGNPFGGKHLSTGFKSASCICVCQGAYCLGTTAGGHPKHPLYLASDTPLIPWKQAEY